MLCDEKKQKDCLELPRRFGFFFSLHFALMC